MVSILATPYMVADAYDWPSSLSFCFRSLLNPDAMASLSSCTCASIWAGVGIGNNHDGCEL